LSYTVQFPLRLIKNTAFSIDKSLYFAQTTYLKVYFSPLSKFCYASTQNNNPSAEAKSTYQPAAGNAVIGPMTGAANNISFQLMLAVETNQDLRTMIINKVTSPGLSYLIPYVQAFKTSNQGESQTISIQLDQGNGRSLMKVYHSPYNSFEQEDCMYDHANTIRVLGADAANNQKVFQYYTQLNGKRLQDITLDCTATGPFTDYMQHKRMLRGSIL